MKKLFFASLLFVSCVSTVHAQDFISATLLGQRTKTQIAAQFNLPIIQYGARYYRVLYTTPDINGDLDTASGLLVLPNDVTKVFPKLVYQHGTSNSKFAVPSRYGSAGGDEGAVGLVFAGMGFATMLPDYLGMGDARGFHPYVHAASEASAAIDMVRACNQYFANNNVAVNDQLFITGYSQGGHAGMALHRAIENQTPAEFEVTAAAHLSGPYSISGAMRDLILSELTYFYPAYIPNTVLGYQEAYKNIYSSLDQIFKPAYITPIQQYRNGTIGLTQLNTQLIQKLTAETGASKPRWVLQDSIVTLMQTEPNHPINKALRDNDTYNNWTPVAPMRLFYCMADDQVPFMNSIIARDSILLTSPGDFQVTDVGATLDHGGCFNPALTQTLLFFIPLQQISVGTKEVNAAFEWTLGPNPANDLLRISSAVAGEGKVYLTNMQGSLYYAGDWSGGSHDIQLGAIPNGTYTVFLATQAGIRHAQVVVQHP